MSVPRTIRILGAAAAVLALSSCSKSVLEAPTVLIKNPVFESARLPVGFESFPVGPLAGSQIIVGEVGGSLSVGSFRIEVPAGAFQGWATISITQTDPTILKCDLGIDPPSANQFAVPVTLVAKLPNASALTTDQNMWYDPSVSAWRLIGSAPDPLATELRSDLWHFSTYATGRAGW
jgi:hypothetical protein